MMKRWTVQVADAANAAILSTLADPHWRTIAVCTSIEAARAVVRMITDETIETALRMASNVRVIRRDA